MENIFSATCSACAIALIIGCELDFPHSDAFKYESELFLSYFQYFDPEKNTEKRLK